MKRVTQKYIAFACCCVLIFTFTSQAATAARRSNVLPIALFVSGIGLQFGSNFFNTSAQNEYDTYLNVAIQADIQTHKDAYLSQRSTGTIMSRVGLGCVGLAVLLSIYNQLDTPEPAEVSVDSTLPTGHLKTATEIPLARFNGFTPRFSGNASLLVPRTPFQLHPHYDFQTGQASLSLLHFF